ncbi:single-stranded DNA-binding protein [Candidatus Saccharibacteria bacterium]|nr:single-stranded DNA-binding protein [Candidatus Saccharibacteria bacterium]
MRGFSKAIITGNITRDPELRTTTGGSSVCSFTVAVNRNYRGTDGEQKEEVSFIDCSAWGKLAETIAQYGKKGNGVLVSGRLNQRAWEDKNGNKRSSVEIVVEDFNFVGGKDGGNASGSYSAPANNPSQEENIPDDIPEEIELDEVPF